MRSRDQGNEPQPTASVGANEKDGVAASSQIPAARGLPVAGNALALLRDMRGFVTERYQELGPVYRIRVMNRRFTVLAGPEANRFVQRDGAEHLRSYEYWSRFNSRFGAARSVLSTEGAEHKVFRDVFRRAYSRRFALDHASGLVDIARSSISSWPPNAPISVTPALQRIVTDQVGTLTTEVSPRPYIEELVHFVGVLLLTIQPNPAQRPGEIRLALDPYLGAGRASARGIAVTQTSSPARAAARHASRDRLA